MRLRPALSALVCAPILLLSPSQEALADVAVAESLSRRPANEQMPTPLGCATKQEYARVKRGMTVRRVSRIFGTRGYAWTGSRYAWTYPACSRGESVTISYRLSQKRLALVVRGKRWNLRR